MKWLAALLVIIGVVFVSWAVVNEPKTGLRNLPIIITAVLGGVGIACVGAIWLLTLVLEAA